MNSIVRLQYNNEEYSIIDNFGNIIVGDIHNVEEFNRSENDTIIRFMTKDNEYSYINSLGLYFDKYSYKEYDIVCELIPLHPIYKVKKNKKYGIINSYYNEAEILSCVFDEITFLPSNIFVNNDIVKLRKNDRYSLIHGTEKKYNNNKDYDYIYTPIQPLEQFIVCQSGRYGFIDIYSLEEYVEPTYVSIEELCKQYKYNIEKYTKDLYITNAKLQLKQIAVPEQPCSYIIDANKIVKNKWGGNGELVKHGRTNEVYVHYLYYTAQRKQIPINMYGYFYNLFDCRKYDVVTHATRNFYLIIKNNKYGLIDDEFHMILDVLYENISLVCFSQLEEMPLFVVTCQNGQFLYNAETGMQTQLYDSLAWHDDIYISGFYRDYLVYEEYGKFGLLSPEGNVIIKAKFDLYKIDFGERDRIERGHAYFQEIFHGRKYGFYIENNKFYGKVPVDKYDSCIRIGGKFFNNYYIVKTKGKYRLLNHRCDEIAIPLLDEMFFAKNPMNSIFGALGRCRRLGCPLSETFLIGLIENKYYLYSVTSLKNSQEAKLIISDCDEMEFIEAETSSYGLKNEYPYIRFKKNKIEGFVNEDGIVISSETFDEIKPIEVVRHSPFYYLTYKGGKMGLLNAKRKVLFPCIYDDIQQVTPWSALVTENGIEKEAKYNHTTGFQDDDSFDVLEESPHYSRYAGSYAQDEMGYSDEDIDTIFDGDPDAYWNID